MTDSAFDASSVEDNEKFADIVCIVLAAGGSSRLGQAKQLLSYKGKPLLQNAVNAAIDFNHNLAPIVVLGAAAESIESTVDLGACLVVRNPGWQKGMGTSIACAIAFLLENYQGARGVVLTLGDQPHVSASVLRHLVSRAHGANKPIAISEFASLGSAGPVGQTISGPPVYFDRRFFKQLAALEGDLGARKIIQANPTQVVKVDFPLGAIDIDTQADYAKLMAQEKVVKADA